MTTKEETISPLAPLVGQLVWSVRRGVGTFLTMEFGSSHLSVREPIVPRSAMSARNRRDLLRRKVFVTGDWHLWIQHADWKLETVNGSLSSRDDTGSRKDEWLRDLDGQRLMAAAVAKSTRRWTLKFDLGAILAIWPATYQAEELWSVHGRDGHIVVCQQDGSIVHHKAKRT